MSRRPTEDREAPRDLDAERSVLAAMMLDSEAAAQAAELLDPQHFYDASHGKIFAALASLVARGEAPGTLTLMAELEARGDLVLVGGLAALATIAEAATTSVNLDHNVRRVREKHARREIRDSGRRLVLTSEDPGADVSGAVDTLTERIAHARDGLSNGRAIDDWLTSAPSGSELIEQDCPPVDSIVGSGLLVRGGVSFLVSASGFGKTFLALQLMRSVASGEDFLGYATQQGQAGMLQLEMARAPMRGRVSTLMAPYPNPIRDRLGFQIMPTYLGPITELRTQDLLIGWCHRRQLSLLIVDPFDEASGSLDTAKQVEARQVMQGWLRVARKGQAAVLLVHHVNKMQFERGTGMRTMVLNMLRGSSHLTNPVDTILGLLEAPGRVMLGFGKARHSATPHGDQIALRRTPDGYFEVTDTPEQVGDGSQAKILAALERYGASGATAVELQAAADMSRATLLRHLNKMAIPFIEEDGRGGRRRYFVQGMQPDEAAEQTEAW